MIRSTRGTPEGLLNITILDPIIKGTEAVGEGGLKIIGIGIESTAGGIIGAIGIIGGEMLFPPAAGPPDGNEWGPGQHNPGDPMGGNQEENALTDRIARELGLTPEEARELHDLITGQHFTPEQIWQIAEDIVRSRGSKNLGRKPGGGRGPGSRGKGRNHNHC